MATSNTITNVAIVGAGGNVGKYISEALIKAGKNVTAISRPDSKASMPTGLHATKHVDYSSRASLVEALRGQEVLIITMSVFAPKSSQTALIDAAVEAGVRYVMPNEWGINHADEGLARDTLLGEPLLAIRDYIEKVGGEKTKWISVICGFWYEWSLAGSEARYGFDFEKKAVTFFDDGKQPICTTTWPGIGRAVAALLSLKVRPEGEEAGVSQFEGKSVFISSFTVNQRDVLASVLRVTGDSEKDWTISYEDSKERYARGYKMFKEENDMQGFGILLYTRDFYPDGCGDFSARLDNKILGLPEESLDEATKVAVEMAREGGVPH